jgi:serine/threonine protein kinase
MGEWTDVYGLGAVLYELLTGQPPFDGADLPEVLRRVVRELPVPPRRRVAATPLALQAVCRKALAKAPASRYASAREMGRDVERFLADEPLPGGWDRSRRGTTLSAFFAVNFAQGVDSLRSDLAIRFPFHQTAQIVGRLPSILAEVGQGTRPGREH